MRDISISTIDYELFIHIGGQKFGFYDRMRAVDEFVKYNLSEHVCTLMKQQKICDQIFQQCEIPFWGFFDEKECPHFFGLTEEYFEDKLSFEAHPSIKGTCAFYHGLNMLSYPIDDFNTALDIATNQWHISKTKNALRLIKQINTELSTTKFSEN